MHSARAALRHLDQSVDAQIAFARPAPARSRCASSHSRTCSALRVGLRIDRDGAQAEPLGGAGDAAGDLAAIGDQDGFEHRRARLRLKPILTRGQRGRLLAALRRRPLRRRRHGGRGPRLAVCAALRVGRLLRQRRLGIHDADRRDRGGGGESRIRFADVALPARLGRAGDRRGGAAAAPPPPARSWARLGSRPPA